MSVPSKREFLSMHTNPDTGKPFAVFPGRGRFSAEAEAFASEHAGEFSEAVAVVKVPKAPKPAPVVTASVATPVRQGEYDPKAVRAWAVAEGLVQAGSRGRIAATVTAKYMATDGGHVAERAKRPTPLMMPKRRPEVTGFTVVGGTLIRQSECGNCRVSVARCACPEPRAYRWLERETGGPLMLTLDKPSL